MNRCPICNRMWKLDMYGMEECCELHHYQNGMEEEVVRYIPPYSVRWEIDNRSCRISFWVSPMDARNFVVDAPWLPFTITKEDLQRYLVLL